MKSNAKTESLRTSQALNNAAEQAIYRCLKLAECTEEPGCITRRFLTDPVHAAHGLVQQWMRQAGMKSWTDAAGNLIGVLADPSADEGWTKPTIVLGSHLDTVPNAGAYDGILGVMIGLAVAEHFRASCLTEDLPVSITVVGFSEEEGVRFAQPYLGSAAFAGTFSEDWLKLRDQSERTLYEAICDFGLQPERIPLAAIPAEKVLAFIEPHLEQGPILEAKDLPVGVVTAIVGQTRLLVRFQGEAGHAGTTPMDTRRDALVAAAEWILAVNQMGRSHDGLRATVGRMNVLPNATNVIPAEVTMSLDLRHADDLTRLKCVERLVEHATSISQTNGVTFEIKQRSDSCSVHAAPQMVQRMCESVLATGHEPIEMTSGAGHDAVIMGQRFPMTMLFVRHPGGISHHPDERVDTPDVQVAIDTLIRFVQTVAFAETGHPQ